ncbi:choloylglycine hydrolase family protein [Lactiplantibacillus plantarum]|uniref:choloylglycine hydrolase family protein n=1 Tax=Lactiplantibacillus plantarum TaxID=1590 RepID=UPI001BA65A52|nr:choloylglycine hydrolase family protein [Lactiplantibacillus plantarum]MBS0937881.1 choloylglycine hydrolase family protein [Lactiplantibacillus plantarum]MBS0945920.1 choloylglycine hydrolase family protein [Lactiplantibacillus plantarum]
MCTAITFSTDDDLKFLARTMDFSFELNAKPVFIPKSFTFNSHIEGSSFKSTYGFIGAGRDVNGYIFADGLNSQGFGIATLYFEGNAHYGRRKKGFLNLASEELVSWALGSVKSVSDFEEKIKQINIVAKKNSIIESVVPLHWIVSDNTGVTKCLEITESGVHLYDNQVGVMTNSPEFPWHLTNLSHYNNLQPTEYLPKKYGSFKREPDGPGTGLSGLPGDYTATSRFIRAAVLREYISNTTGEYQGVNEIQHLLNSVDIPKGVKITNNKTNTADYTQYRGIMDLSNKVYYMLSYDNVIPKRVSLDSDLLSKTEPVEFDIENDEQISKLFNQLSTKFNTNTNLSKVISALQ